MWVANHVGCNENRRHGCPGVDFCKMDIRNALRICVLIRRWKFGWETCKTACARLFAGKLGRYGSEKPSSDLWSLEEKVRDSCMILLHWHPVMPSKNIHSSQAFRPFADVKTLSASEAMRLKLESARRSVSSEACRQFSWKGDEFVERTYRDCKQQNAVEWRWFEYDLTVVGVNSKLLNQGTYNTMDRTDWVLANPAQIVLNGSQVAFNFFWPFLEPNICDKWDVFQSWLWDETLWRSSGPQKLRKHLMAMWSDTQYQLEGYQPNVTGDCLSCLALSTLERRACRRRLMLLMNSTSFCRASVSNRLQLEQYAKKLSQQILDLIMLLRKGAHVSAKTFSLSALIIVVWTLDAQFLPFQSREVPNLVDCKVNKLQTKTMNALIVIDVHAKDSVSHLLRVKSIKDGRSRLL